MAAIVVLLLYAYGAWRFSVWLRRTDPLGYWKPGPLGRFLVADVVYYIAGGVWPLSCILIFVLRRRSRDGR